MYVTLLGRPAVAHTLQTLVAPNRNLQKEGDLNFYKTAKSKNEKRHVFFFSDMIMLTIRKGEKKFEHKLSISFEDCTLTVLADSSSRFQPSVGTLSNY